MRYAGATSRKTARHESMARPWEGWWRVGGCGVGSVGTKEEESILSTIYLYAYPHAHVLVPQQAQQRGHARPGPGALALALALALLPLNHL